MLSELEEIFEVFLLKTKKDISDFIDGLSENESNIDLFVKFYWVLVLSLNGKFTEVIEFLLTQKTNCWNWQKFKSYLKSKLLKKSVN